MTKNTFTVSYCDPLKPDEITLGIKTGDQVLKTFQDMPWTALLRQKETAKAEDIYFYPGIQVKNTLTKHSLVISAVGEADNFSFNIFYSRPKLIKTKTWFGYQKQTEENYQTNLNDQSENIVMDCLSALLRDDLLYLARIIGE